MTRLSNPDEQYHETLPDHKWHNDLTWEQLPDWVKGNSSNANKLLHGRASRWEKCPIQDKSWKIDTAITRPYFTNRTKEYEQNAK